MAMEAMSTLKFDLLLYLEQATRQSSDSNLNNKTRPESR